MRAQIRQVKRVLQGRAFRALVCTLLNHTVPGILYLVQPEKYRSTNVSKIEGFPSEYAA